MTKREQELIRVCEARIALLKARGDDKHPRTLAKLDREILLIEKES